MGEYAEDSIDQSFAHYEADLYGGDDESQMFDDDGPFYSPRRKSITCNRCGTRGLHWGDIGDDEGNEVWRLFDEDENQHTCKKRTP
jgi:hypothetical protein